MTSQNVRIVKKHDTGSLLAQQRWHSNVHFDIHYHQILNADGLVVGNLPDFAKQPEQLIALYRIMVKTRLFDEKAISLQRSRTTRYLRLFLGSRSDWNGYRQRDDWR